MSEEEKFAEQGRAHNSLKQSKTLTATIRASLLRYNQRLEETNSFLKQFLADPLATGADNIPIAQYMKGEYRNLVSSTFESNVDQLVVELNRTKELQEQIDNF